MSWFDILVLIFVLKCVSYYDRIALTNSGHLLEICPYTRTVNKCHTARRQSVLIEDLLVIESSEENIELLLLTKPTEDGRFIKIVEYPCNNNLHSGFFNFSLNKHVLTLFNL